jgi:hypothetical protein
VLFRPEWKPKLVSVQLAQASVGWMQSMFAKDANKLARPFIAWRFGPVRLA